MRQIWRRSVKIALVLLAVLVIVLVSTIIGLKISETPKPPKGHDGIKGPLCPKPNWMCKSTNVGCPMYKDKSCLCEDFEECATGLCCYKRPIQIPDNNDPKKNDTESSVALDPIFIKGRDFFDVMADKLQNGKDTTEDFARDLGRNVRNFFRSQDDKEIGVFRMAKRELLDDKEIDNYARVMNRKVTIEDKMKGARPVFVSELRNGKLVNKVYYEYTLDDTPREASFHGVKIIKGQRLLPGEFYLYKFLNNVKETANSDIDFYIGIYIVTVIIFTILQVVFVEVWLASRIFRILIAFAQAFIYASFVLKERMDADEFSLYTKFSIIL